MLNKLGICSSYDGLRDALEATAGAIRNRLGSICLPGEAIWVSFDNLTYVANVRDHRLFNRGDFIVCTAGYVVVPPRSQQEPMFTHADCDYRSAIEAISVVDFLPTKEDKATLMTANRYSIYTILKTFANAENISLPNLAYKRPEIFQLDHHARSEIIPLPTYDLNEGCDYNRKN